MSKSYTTVSFHEVTDSKLRNGTGFDWLGTPRSPLLADDTEAAGL